MPRLTPALLLCAAAALPARAADPVAPLDLSFLPPDYAQRDLCNQPIDPEERRDLSTGTSGIELTDKQRVLFLRRDARRLQREDAARYFDYIERLIARRAELDDEFAGANATIARIRLHVAAGKLAALTESGLVASLTAQSAELNNAQRMILAQFHQTGIGTDLDTDLALELILESAYGGHPEALLEIVRRYFRGLSVEGWEAPMDLTVTMAFGGMLGGMTPELCRRAEAVAREYEAGELVRAVPETALAWRRFAADMGGAEAAWRVVAYHLDAPAARKDDAELRRYLKRAIDLGLALDAAQRAQVMASGAVTAEELLRMLGHNHSADAPRTPGSVIPLLELDVEVDAQDSATDGLYLDHLREIVALPGAPGRVFTWLAKELAVKEGRWAAEDEVMALLREAVRRGDPEAMQILAERLVRYRDDPVRLASAENLLLRAVDEHGYAPAMRALDSLYRCQVPEAPRLAEAEHWAEAYRATGHAALTISPTDLIALDPFKDPEALARIQTHALGGRATPLARQVQRMMSDHWSSAVPLHLWADLLDNSAQALEAFAEIEFELATSPAQRAQAVEFFRRVYLNNGVTTALDLAIALIEDHGRDPEVAAEVVRLLTQAGHRGEGAAIRLLARLQAGERSAAEVYADFAEDIEARGDFLAMMVAIPHLPPERVEDYIDRAVSQMNCGTKDADELGDAYAIHADGVMSYHWRRVGLHFEGGHVLAKLRLSNPQMAMYAAGALPDAAAVAAREAGEGGRNAHRRAFWLAANPDLETYDPRGAAEILVAAVQGDATWAAGAWRRAGPAIREIVDEAQDLRAMSRAAAEHGSSAERFDFAMLLRERAEGPEDLAESALWLTRAAEAGHTDAMVELGFALGFGLGVPRDDRTALEWLDRAAGKSNDRAPAMAALLRARTAD